MISEITPKRPRGRPWLKGKSGNPAGRPKGPPSRMRQAIEAALAEPRAGDLTIEDVIARKLVDMAAEGDLKAIELLLKRTWPEKLEFGIDEESSDLARDLIEARRRVREMRDKKFGSHISTTS
jgi:hypothetical protein